MIKKLKYFLKNRKNLSEQLVKLIEKKSGHRERFFQLYNYWPEGLEYNKIDILRLGKTSVIGKFNKLILSEILFPGGDKESAIFLGEYAWTGTNVELNVISGSQIVIKEYSSIQDNCKLIGDVTVEKYCLFAPAVFVSSGNHYAVKGNPDIIRNQDTAHLTNQQLLTKHSKPVHIEEDCWLGYSVFISQGVYIGKGAVIGANSVITKDVKPYAVMGAVNKQLNSRIDFDPPEYLSAKENLLRPYFYRGFFHKIDEPGYSSDVSFIGMGKTSVIILKKGNLDMVKFSGKTALGIQTSVKFDLILNATQLTTIELITNENGFFNTCIDQKNFIIYSGIETDSVFRLSSEYNVFVFIQHDTNAVKSCNIQIEHFEEKLL